MVGHPSFRSWVSFSVAVKQHHPQNRVTQNNIILLMNLQLGQGQPISAPLCVSWAAQRLGFAASSEGLAPGTSLAVQWLRLHASTAISAAAYSAIAAAAAALKLFWTNGSIPGRGTKIPHAARRSHRRKRKKKKVKRPGSCAATGIVRPLASLATRGPSSLVASG